VTEVRRRLGLGCFVLTAGARLAHVALLSPLRIEFEDPPKWNVKMIDGCSASWAFTIARAAARDSGEPSGKSPALTVAGCGSSLSELHAHLQPPECRWALRPLLR
jgi:hypothetical protein